MNPPSSSSTSSTIPKPTPLHRQHVKDFYLYVETLEKENRHLKNEIKHLKAQIQRLNPPEKPKSYYDIKWNPVLKCYVRGSDKIEPSAAVASTAVTRDQNQSLCHDNQNVALLFEFMTQNEVSQLREWLQNETSKWQKMVPLRQQGKKGKKSLLNAHKEQTLQENPHLHDLLKPNEENFSRTLLHCFAMTINYLNEDTITMILQWIHSELLKATRSDEAKVMAYWTELWFQTDLFGFSPMHLILLMAEKKTFRQTIGIFMRELISLGVLRTEAFLMGCAIQIRLTPKRSFGYKNRYLDTWWIEEMPYSAILIKYDDLLEFVREKDNLFESEEWDLYLADFAFLESVLKDFSTNADKNDYIAACIEGNDAKIRVRESHMSPGVLIEGVYLACAHGHIHVVQRWISEAENMDVQPGFFERGFRDAVCNGHLQVVKLLTGYVGIRADELDQINCIRHDRFECFLYLASESNITRLQYCVEALKYIAKEGQYTDFARKIVQLEWFHLPDRFHEGDIFDLSFKNRHYELVEIIFDSLHSVEEFTSVASYAIMLAAANGDADFIYRITDNPKFSKQHYSWDAVITEDEKTAIFFAAATGDLDLVKFMFTELHSRFALPENTNLAPEKRREREPKNVIHYAAEHGHTSIIEYIAAVLPQGEFDKLIAAKGLDYSDHYRSKFAYEYAQENGYIQTMQYLIEMMDDLLERERDRGISQSSAESLLPDYHPKEQVVEVPAGFSDDESSPTSQQQQQQQRKNLFSEGDGDDFIKTDENLLNSVSE